MFAGILAECEQLDTEAFVSSLAEVQPVNAEVVDVDSANDVVEDVPEEVDWTASF